MLRLQSCIFVLSALGAVSASDNKELDTIPDDTHLDLPRLEQYPPMAYNGPAHGLNWPSRFMFIRHGEAMHNVRKFERDSRLTSKGWQQADRLRSQLLYPYKFPDLVVVSPMRRTVCTAFAGFHEAISHGVPFLLHPDLREMAATNSDWGWRKIV